MEDFKIKNVVLKDDEKCWTKLSISEKELIMIMKTDTKSSVRSLCQYLNKVKSIYKKNKLVFKGDNFDLLKNTEKIDSFLFTYKGSKDYYYAISLVLKNMKDNEDLIKHYTSKMVEGVKEVKKSVRENKKNISQEDNWISYDNMVEMFRKNKHKLDKEDELLLSLIILYPRRVADWRLMKLHKTNNINSKDINYNYININKFETATTFDFNRSKSQEYEVLGTSHTIPNKLKNIIMKYVKQNNINSGDFFFGNNGEEFSSNDFSLRIKKVFKIISDKEITSNLWRHIVSSDMDNKNYNLNEREDRANQLGHSLIRSMEYSKK